MFFFGGGSLRHALAEYFAHCICEWDGSASGSWFESAIGGPEWDSNRGEATVAAEINEREEAGTKRSRSTGVRALMGRLVTNRPTVSEPMASA
jgi:hypothetical protein